MRAIEQLDNTTALLISEPTRMRLANDIATSAGWLDDHKHHFNNLGLFEAAAALCENLHDIAHALAGDRAEEIYHSEDAETDIDQATRRA